MYSTTIVRVCYAHRARRGRNEVWGSVSALSAGAYTETLYVMVNIVNGVGAYPYPYYSMMECTQESGRCHSVCTKLSAL
jgi:hypothetical protein